MNFQSISPHIYRLASRILVAFGLVLLVAGCAYKSEIRQGREQVLERIGEVSVGMQQNEVIDILGQGQIQPFSKNVWIYAFRIRESGFVGAVSLLSMELTFDDAGTLTNINVTHNDFDEDGQ